MSRKCGQLLYNARKLNAKMIFLKFKIGILILSISYAISSRCETVSRIFCAQSGFMRKNELEHRDQAHEIYLLGNGNQPNRRRILEKLLQLGIKIGQNQEYSLKKNDFTFHYYKNHVFQTFEIIAIFSFLKENAIPVCCRT